MSKVEYISVENPGMWTEYSRTQNIDNALNHKDILEARHLHVRVIENGTIQYETPS
jgi:hypothetical protein